MTAFGLDDGEENLKQQLLAAKRKAEAESEFDEGFDDSFGEDGSENAEDGEDAIEF